MILPFYFSDNEAIKGKDFIYFIKFPTLCIITHIRGFSFLWEYGCLFLPVDSSFMEKKYLGKICIWAFFDWSLKAFFKFAFFFFYFVYQPQFPLPPFLPSSPPPHSPPPHTLLRGDKVSLLIPTKSGIWSWGRTRPLSHASRMSKKSPHREWTPKTQFKKHSL